MSECNCKPYGYGIGVERSCPIHGEEASPAAPCSHKRVTDIVKERGWPPLPDHLREDRTPTVSGENADCPVSGEAD